VTLILTLPRRICPRQSAGDTGSVSLEIAVVSIVLFTLIGGLLVLAGRSNIAEGSIDSAAKSAARAASLARDADTAQSSGQRAATSELATAGVPCSSWTVSVDTSQFGAAVGQAASVTATVSCTVSYSDLLIPGLPMPGSRVLTATFTSVIDRYRARG
jgi:hypothetical protein